MIRNLSVRTKLLLLVGASTLGLLYLSVGQLRESLAKMGSAEEMGALGQLAELSVAVNEFVHEAQKERGRTSGFVASGGKSYRDELGAQRKLTDEKVAILQKKIESAPSAAREGRIGAALTLATKDYLAKLGEHRTKVDALSIEPAGAIGFYTRTIASFFDFSGQLLAMSDDAEMSRLLVTYAALGEAKERMGQERALFNNVFTKGAFDGPGTVQKAVAIIAEQNSYLRSFRAQAPETILAVYDEKVKGPEVTEAEELRTKALAATDSKSLGVEAKRWFAVVSKKIDLVKEVEDNVAQRSIKVALKSQTEARADFIATMTMLVIVLAITIMFAVTIIRSITIPIRSTVGILQRVANGDLSPWEPIDRKDEIGVMAHALAQAVDAMRKTLVGVQTTSANVAGASTELLSASQSIARGAQSQAAGQEETAASLVELTQQVKHNAESTAVASGVAQEARREAATGQEIVANAITAMSAINESSKRIAAITATIDEIAFQTNLLALNAAVEAARAGETGRGFAVVASEVRCLAQRSATSAKEIRGLISDSQVKVDSGAALIGRSGETLKSVVHSVDRVAALIVELAESARSQASGLDQSRAAVEQMSEVTQSNAAQTEELSGTAESLTSQATELESLVSRFRLSE